MIQTPKSDIIKAVNCLYLEVDNSIVADIKSKLNAYMQLAEDAASQQDATIENLSATILEKEGEIERLKQSIIDFVNARIEALDMRVDTMWELQDLKEKINAINPKSNEK